MPDAPALSGLYPRPPDPSSTGLISGDPLRLIGAAQALQSLGLQRQQLPALAQQPAAALQGTQIENQTRLLQQRDAQRRIIANAFGTIAGMDKPTPNDVHSQTTYLSRTYPEIPSSLINDTADVMLNHPTGIKDGARLLLNMGLTPGEASTRVSGPPNPKTGATTSMSLAESNMAGARDVGLPPGAEKSAGIMQDDLARARNFGSEMFPWQQALDAANKLEDKYGKGYFAPGSKGRQEFQSFFYGVSPTLARWLGGDEEKLKNYAEADKYLTQAVQSRAANFGVHSDQGLATTISGSPNVSVNDLAVKDVIKASMALRQAEHAQTLASAKAGPVNYTAASAAWPAQHDIRAFLLDKISPEARTKLLSSLKPGSPEYKKFNATLREAYDTGLMTRPGGAPNAP